MFVWMLLLVAAVYTVNSVTGSFVVSYVDKIRNYHWRNKVSDKKKMGHGEVGSPEKMELMERPQAETGHTPKSKFTKDKSKRKNPRTKAQQKSHTKLVKAYKKYFKKNHAKGFLQKGEVRNKECFEKIDTEHIEKKDLVEFYVYVKTKKRVNECLEILWNKTELGDRPSQFRHIKETLESLYQAATCQNNQELEAATPVCQLEKEPRSGTRQGSGHIPLHEDLKSTTWRNQELETLKEGIKSLQTENKTLEEKNQQLKTKNEGLKIENEKLKTEKGGLDNENEKLKKENKRFWTKNEELNGEKEDLKKEIEGLKKDNKLFWTKNEGSNKEKEDLNKQNEGLKRKNEELKKKENKKLTENKDLMAENEELKKDKEKLKIQNEGLIKEKGDVRKKNNELKLENEKTRTENVGLSTKNGWLKTEIERLNTKNGELKTENENQIGILHGEIKELKIENCRLINESEELKISKRKRVTISTVNGSGDFKQCDEKVMQKVIEKLKEKEVDLEMIPWDVATQQNTNGKSILMVFCINTSRLGTDVDAAVLKAGVTENTKTILVIFHHKPSHSSNPQPSKSILTQDTLKKARAKTVVDCLYWSKEGLYESEVNDLAIQQLTDKLEHWAKEV